MSWPELQQPTTRAFLPAELGLAPLNSEEWQRMSPAKFGRPLMWDGKSFSPEWPVAWMICRGWRGRVSTFPFCERSIVTVQRRALSSHEDFVIELLVQTLSSRSVAYDSKNSASLSLGLKTGQ